MACRTPPLKKRIETRGNEGKKQGGMPLPSLKWDGTEAGFLDYRAARSLFPSLQPGASFVALLLFSCLLAFLSAWNA